MTLLSSKFSAVSFRAILFTIAIVSILPTLMFSGVLLERYARSERQRAERGLVESTRAIARSIDGQFKAAEAALLVLRESPLLDQADLNGTLSYAFALPRSISRTGKVARSSLSMTVSKATQCLQRQNQTACEVISDTRRQEYRGSIDTDVVSALTAGLQLGYTINDFRHLDRKNSQIFLVASLTLSLFAGDFR